MPTSREFEEIIKDCDKIRIVNFLKTLFPGETRKGKIIAKFGGSEQKTRMDGLNILGSVILETSDGRSKPVICCAKQMGGILSERSSRRKQFDESVAVLKDVFAKPYVGSGPVEGAFTQGLFFFFDELGNFRLSLVSAEISAGKMELNNYRRQSFYVEAGARNNTFRTRICKKISAYEDLKNAFDVEKLSDDFFREYKVFYKDIVQYVTGARYIEVKKNKYERTEMSAPHAAIFDQFVEAYGNADAEKAVRNYVKKLMGRLVFIQFLQKKGWLGIPVGTGGWNGGDKDFLQHLFDNVSPEEQNDFVDKVLEEVLFYSFNRKENERKLKNSSLKKWKFPFLNCGLFDKDKDDNFNFPLPASVFHNKKFGNTERKAPDIKNWKKRRKPYFNDEVCGLFDFFDRFNFTIDENDPTDAEVSVDPEMLGKIFENLLEDNKDKGAFYTPKEIVGYMCNESLIAYLENECPQLRHAEKSGESAIRSLVADLNAASFSEEEKKALDQKLSEVKICDPAIGSGAFPMGLLNLLYKIRLKLGVVQKKSKNPEATLKREIIQQNIYGVDIEKGAVDIAQLRFWLSLVVDETEPDALPNLEYKIMQGNSLLESYEGIDLSALAGESKNRSRSKASEQMSLVFDEKEAMEQIQKDLNSFYKTDDYNVKEHLKKDINQNVKNYIKHIAPEKSKAIDALPLPNDKFFLWHTYFRDVFDRKGKSGFDIVIGNPPYVNANELKKQMGTDKYNLLKSFFKTSKGAVDFYVYFFESGLNLLRDDGVLSFITPNKFLCANYGVALRQFFIDNSKFISFWDVSRTQCFNASVYPIVTTVYKKNVKKKYLFNVLNECGIVSQFSSDTLTSLPENIWGFLLSDKYKLVKKIIDSSSPLTSVCKINATSTAGEADYFHNYISENKTSLRLVNTGTIDPYVSLWGIRYLVDKGEKYLTPYLTDDAKILKNRTLTYKSTKIIVAKMASRLEGVYDEFGIYASVNTNCLHTITCSPYFLLAWVHSKVFDMVYNCFFEGLKMAGGYLPFSAPYLSCMVIPKSFGSIEKAVSLKVDSILAAKKKNPSADTSKQEAEIDKLVYELYGLTPEEIAIVEGDCRASNEARNDVNKAGALRQAQGSATTDDDFLQGENL
ncbi:Eco57I restriction-modification methylase domain-containing protein [Fibrobacter intestinalis]|uniref:site-specific DNA-methyltransferase (adenine-specific) n=1 Tax=Fibrobacter intestinalis TaxID=28122 RepID=A0A1T4LZR4_9BACT|nr:MULTISPECIES: DNA methyltransferase [Fibrobacter]PBC74812.1 Eco57I restriction-modification methylase [Fibrobacter sp. NR9]SJZ60145.1 Eco57I restriction-modification methylase [Fibrobacter intestinalis]